MTDVQDYVLVGGPYTPSQYVGKAMRELAVDVLLAICQQAVPPHISHDGVTPPDTTDADVLGVRAYLNSSWGQMRLLMTGNITL